MCGNVAQPSQPNKKNVPLLLLDRSVGTEAEKSERSKRDETMKTHAEHTLPLLSVDHVVFDEFLDFAYVVGDKVAAPLHGEQDLERLRPRSAMILA